MDDARPDPRLAAARAGDPQAIESLFARHLPPLIAFLRARTGRVVADRESLRDLAQSVCREVLQDWSELELRDEASFRSWLYLQATRKILNRKRFFQQAMRDAGREVAGADEEMEAAGILRCYGEVATPSHHASAREELARLERAVASLPDAQRDAVTMTRLLGLSTAEVADQLGCTESAVRGLVARGLARLSTQLDAPPDRSS